jgi:protein subunit release factor B
MRWTSSSPSAAMTDPQAKPGRELLFSVTLKDCEVQHFRSGGPGGQNQNKRDTGTRIIHHPSGARGESREERSQLQNTKTAFRRMASTPHFRSWASRTARLHGRNIEAEVREQMRPEFLRVETFHEGQWEATP